MSAQETLGHVILRVTKNGRTYSFDEGQGWVILNFSPTLGYLHVWNSRTDEDRVFFEGDLEIDFLGSKAPFHPSSRTSLEALQ